MAGWISAREKPAYQQVPHHPAGGREPEEPVFIGKIQVQRNRLQVLNQDTSVALDDGLRHTSGAGGIQDPKRVVEWHRRKGHRYIFTKQLIPLGGVG